MTDIFREMYAPDAEARYIDRFMDALKHYRPGRFPGPAVLRGSRKYRKWIRMWGER